MRQRRSITIARLLEALTIGPTGLLTFTIDNGRDKADHMARFSAPRGRGRLYINLDGQTVAADRAAWALHYGEWPRGRVVPRNGDPYDFSKYNLVLRIKA